MYIYIVSRPLKLAMLLKELGKHGARGRENTFKKLNCISLILQTRLEDLPIHIVILELCFQGGFTRQRLSVGHDGCYPGGFGPFSKVLNEFFIVTIKNTKKTIKTLISSKIRIIVLKSDCNIIGHPFFSKERNILAFFCILFKRTKLSHVLLRSI